MLLHLFFVFLYFSHKILFFALHFLLRWFARFLFDFCLTRNVQLTTLLFEKTNYFCFNFRMHCILLLVFVVEPALIKKVLLVFCCVCWKNLLIYSQQFCLLRLFCSFAHTTVLFRYSFINAKKILFVAWLNRCYFFQ